MITKTAARLAVLALCLAALVPARAAEKAAGRDVTFIATSDSHYAAVVKEDRNARNLDTVRAMNAVTDLSWPDALGGDRLARPRGVLLLGDVIDDGDLKVEGVNRSELQYAAFEKHFGLDGRDGLLKYPVFETWGNHDGPPVGAEKNGFSSQANLKRRNAVRARKGLVSRVSENGLHYSWDWDEVHFVQLGIYPADRQREGIRYSPVWHDPQNALSFLKRDLAETVGKSGRPVVLMSHTGFDSDWWVPADWAELYEAVKPYNVVLYLYGHSGTGVRQWAPEGESRKLLCLNTGQTENGFFVVHIRDNRIRFGYRAKQWEEAPGTPPSRTWTGAWAWKWAGQAEITPTGSARVRWDG